MACSVSYCIRDSLWEGDKDLGVCAFHLKAVRSKVTFVVVCSNCEALAKIIIKAKDTEFSKYYFCRECSNCTGSEEDELKLSDYPVPLPPRFVTKSGDIVDQE